MKLQDMIYFDKLVELKSYSKVAEHFQVSQPTISYAIKRLEEEFAVSLVDRNVHQQIIITPNGLQFDRHIKVVINELNIAQLDLVSAREKVTKFGLPPIIANYYFLKFVDQLLSEQLLTGLRTIEAGSNDLLARLKKGELDLSLLGSLAPIRTAQLQSQVLAQDDFKIIVAKNSPLAQQKKIAFASLQNEPFLVLGDGFVHRQVFDQLTATQHISPMIVYQVNDVELLKRLVAQGMGISLLTETAIAPSDDLCALDLTDEHLPKFVISLVYRNSTLLTPTQQQLIDVFAR
ncbi:LysR family transcriptional regulator [Lapidilactobacillus bayanensis]|uniref:LysR family transcriptional regulator n=1 Tax=Lapidilactobacillus bayanensis TaxID=2485998 RepID=UPI000F7B9E95|nr:LysR family transcriptional regulator [Lapidilactobacillus bayanensis]